MKDPGLSAGGFTGLWVHVLSSWVCLLSFEGLTYLLLNKMYLNYLCFNSVLIIMQKSCGWIKMSLFIVSQTAEKSSKY